MKLCAFILAVFKNESDCIIIEIPLNEIKKQIEGVLGVTKEDSSFAPLVTSKIPNKKPLVCCGVIFSFERSGDSIDENRSNILSFSKTSDAK